MTNYEELARHLSAKIIFTNAQGEHLLGEGVEAVLAPRLAEAARQIDQYQSDYGTRATESKILAMLQSVIGGKR